MQGEELLITVSIGGAVWSGEPMDDLLNRADEALYDAKRAGRDQVSIAQMPEGWREPGEVAAAG